MRDLTWGERQRLKELVGEPFDDLSPNDFSLIWRLLSANEVQIKDGKVARIPVAYGDGKKSPYGVTYADELTGEFS